MGAQLYLAQIGTLKVPSFFFSDGGLDVRYILFEYFYGDQAFIDDTMYDVSLYWTSLLVHLAQTCKSPQVEKDISQYCLFLTRDTQSLNMVTFACKVYMLPLSHKISMTLERLLLSLVIIFLLYLYSGSISARRESIGYEMPTIPHFICELMLQRSITCVYSCLPHKQCFCSGSGLWHDAERRSSAIHCFPRQKLTYKGIIWPIVAGLVVSYIK